MNRSIWIGGAIAIALILGIVLTHDTKKATAAYSIGSVVPLTGGGANLGVPYARGLQMAVDDINAKGGVNGKKLELNVQDGKLDGATSISALQQILASNHVDIVTTLFHPPAQAMNSVMKETNIPFLYEAYTHSILENQNAFKADFDSDTGCQQLTAYAKGHGYYKKLGVLMSRTEFNDLCLVGMRKVETDITEYRYTFGETDFRTLLAKAKSDGVDTIMTIGIDPEPVLIFKQLSELKYPIKIMCATTSECIYPAVVAAASPQVLEGTLSIDFISPNIGDTAVAKQYAQKYPGAGFTDYTWAAVGYEAVTYIAKAMESCEPDDHACLSDALKKVSGYPTIIGSNGFKDRILQLTNTIYQYHNNQWVAVQ